MRSVLRLRSVVMPAFPKHHIVSPVRSVAVSEVAFYRNFCTGRRTLPRFPSPGSSASFGPAFAAAGRRSNDLSFPCI